MTATRGDDVTAALRVRSRSRLLAWAGRVDAAAWGAVGLVAGFVAVSVWWLAVDRSIPYNDAAQHLFFAIGFYDQIKAGELVEALEFPSFYPPATYLLGAAATFVGGVNVQGPILAQNLVYVPLLALACYQLGRMVAGPAAGLLAVLFALGSPLVIEQFHVFMLDAPQAALIAVTVWLLLASERFSRVGVAALAGAALGLGIATKQLAPLYVLGVIACVLVRGGGWRNWRGLVAFGAVTLAIGAPWYVRQLMLEGTDGMLTLAAGKAAGTGNAVAPAAAPPLVSSANLWWYVWATLNGVLFAPLFAIAAVGVGAAVARVARARPLEDPTLELLCGLGVGWLALNVMPHHDMRYTLGLIVFLAVLGTAWIVRLGGTARVVATSLLVAAIVVAHIGATFGVGGETTRQLPASRTGAYGEGVPPRGRVIVYSNHNFMVSGPHSRPDVLGAMEALRRQGVRTIHWEDEVTELDQEFDDNGLVLFARITNLAVLPITLRSPPLAPGQAEFIRARRGTGDGKPCMRLTDGSGIWLRYVEAAGRELRGYCPPGVG